MRTSGKTLARMNTRLDGIECAALYPTQVPATVDECLKLLQNIAQGKQATTEELEKLSKSVSGLERGIAQGVKSVRESFNTLQTSDKTKQEQEVMKQLAELEQPEAVCRKYAHLCGSRPDAFTPSESSSKST